MRKTIVFVLFILVSTVLQAAPFRFLKYKISQPDGTSYACFVSGDEFYNWIHDEKGFTIIQAQDGYYYYAIETNGNVAPGQYRVGIVDPSTVGLTPWAKISKEVYNQKMQGLKSASMLKSITHQNSVSSGTFNNLVIYIRFSDDSEFTTTRQEYDRKFNQTDGESLKNYFNEVSYEKLTIISTHYPECEMTANLSYKDSHSRNYYRPFNATTNEYGYSSGQERMSREYQLLTDAVTWINANSPVPSSLNIDADGNGLVDNVCFIIKGDCDGWNDLLWGHRSALYSQTLSINGKCVYDYTFQPENQTSVRTLCHEMFHSLGSPDLYHYSFDGLDPVYTWDIMEYGNGHMTAYMKWKYSNQLWITNIPEINTPGTYTLNPLTSSTNNCYKIASPNSVNEYFVVEYRKKTGLYESTLDGDGLIVYRINTLEIGNADGPPDEVYVYRPDGTTSLNGIPYNANFSLTSGRTSINDLTNPSCFLTDGSDGGLKISEISNAGETISFRVTFGGPTVPASVRIAPTANSQTTIFIKSKTPWTASSDQNWLTVSPLSGSTNGTLTLTATSENPSFLPRKATVTVSSNGYDPQTVIVTQDASVAVLTINAGTLSSTLTAQELANISQLKLNGTIDARDFRTMRDLMPMLAEVDLAEAIIVAYNGNEGTSIWGNTNYLANTVPDFAFLNSNWQGKASLTSVVIPNTTISIGNYAFRMCHNIKSFFIPSMVATIGSGTFSYFDGGIIVDPNNQYYRSIDNILYDNNITTLNVSSLSISGNLVIPSTVKNINSTAFAGCDKLKEVIIPASVQSIGYAAFWGCTGLNSIEAKWSVPLNLTSTDVFNYVNKSTCILYVPYGTILLYAAAIQWKDFANIIEMPSFHLSATTLDLSATETSTTIGLSSNFDWTASSDQNWLTVSPLSGSGNSTITFTAEENASWVIRTATVTISVPGVERQTVSVTQQAKSPVPQSISLVPGWNIISSNVVPSNLDMKSIFQSLIDAGSLKKVMDETGKSLENLGVFGGWKNNIGNLNYTKGYKVNVTTPTTLSVEGTPVPLPLDIPLNTGWNIISYPVTNIQDAMTAFQPLITAGKLKKVMDETGKTIENFGVFAGWKNNIGSLNPGKGYKVNVTGTATLTFTESGTKSASIAPELLASNYFKPVFSGNGTDHMNINVVDLNQSNLLPGDELGVFDGSLCVGSATIGIDQGLSDYISIPVSANDGLTADPNGFTEGHPIILKLYRNGKEQLLFSDLLNNSVSAFTKGESMLARVSNSQTTGIDITSDSKELKVICYPNPFSKEITVEVQNAGLEEVTVEIYNINGQKIKMLYKGIIEQALVLKWNGKSEEGHQVSPGVYLCKVNGVTKHIIKEK